MRKKGSKIKFRPWSGGASTHVDAQSARSKTAVDLNQNPKGGAGQDVRRSRQGCADCRRRRVKCDETFPICIRCQKRGSLCQSAPRLTLWQYEAPWIAQSKPSAAASSSTAPVVPQFAAYIDAGCPPSQDEVLLRYWMERASQIMVIDPDENPMSFPIFEYFERCPSLRHTIQSVGAGHQIYFDPGKLSRCLEERSSALQLIMAEVSCPGDNLAPIFMSIFILGLSTAWTNAPTADFGQQHLRGARALVDMLLSEPGPEPPLSATAAAVTPRSPHFNFIIGAYLYWDMATAFLIPHDEQVPINTDSMYTAMLEVGQEYHPVAAYSTEVFYLLSNVGRYCRFVLEGGMRDEAIEAALQEELEAWAPNRENHEFGLISDAFRYHGLISLAAICYRKPKPKPKHKPKSNKAEQEQEQVDDFYDLIADMFSDELATLGLGLSLGLDGGAASPALDSSLVVVVDEDLESSIRKNAVTVVRDQTSIPPSHPCTNLQGIPLFTAASELTAEDVEERRLVVRRFRELYCLNHLRANLSVLQILPEIWDRRDRGEAVSWLGVMVEKGWNIMLG